MQPTIVRSRSAIGLGLFFAAIAAWVLLWDIRAFTDVTTDHVQAIAALAGTIAAGHFAISATRQHLYVWGLMLGIAFCAGTFVCILGSAGRGADVFQRKAADANRSNDARKDALAELAKARSKRDALADQFARECSTGRKERCNGLKFALDSADSHAAILQVRADDAAPEQAANLKIKHAARMLAFFWGYDQGRAEQGLELLWPVALPLINELLSIAFFGIGFGHRRSFLTVPEFPPRLPAPASVSKIVPSTVEETIIEPEWTPMSVNQARELARGRRAEAVFDALRSAGRPICNDELARALRTSKAEASRRATMLVELGLIQRHPRGRYVAISLRPLSA